MAAAFMRPGDVPRTPRQRKESFAQPTAENVWQRSIVQSAQKATNDSTTAKSPWRSDQTSLLQVSPYSEPEHLLDLSTLDTANRLFALALSQLEPSDFNYATAPYSDAFDWAAVLSGLRSLTTSESFHFPRTEFYVVEFRSQLKEVIDESRLANLDKQSHREATASGGLLKYWFGKPDEKRRNLATCLWRSKNDAIEGGKGMWHNQARLIIPTTYESIQISGLRLVVDEGAVGWKFEPWLFH